MENPGQIQGLMEKATRSLAGLKRRGDGEARKTRVDETLARFGIFTHAAVQDWTVDTSESEDGDCEPKIYVSVNVTFCAPDGSYATIHTVGEGSGCFIDASVDACEQARWQAIEDCLEVSVTSE